ncbi:MAG: SpoIIE family protein phosphatase [Fibrobacterota bacterium]
MDSNENMQGVLEYITESVDDTLCLINSDYTVRYINRKGPRASKGKEKCYELLYGINSPCDECPMKELIQSGSREGVSRETFYGDSIWMVSYSPSVGPGGVFGGGIIERIRDITEHRKAEKKLSKAYEEIEEQLAIARQVQLKIMPMNLPETEYIKFAVSYVPIENVGGDIYDFVKLSETEIGIFIADVAGHGVASAFVGAMTKMSFVQHSPFERSPSKLLQKINLDINRHLVTEHFISAFYAVIDFVHNRITFSKAGHPPAFLQTVPSGDTSEMITKGLLLGLMDEGRYEDKTVFFRQGERLVFFTDGIYEARNNTGDKFGMQRLRNVLKEFFNQDPEAASEKVLEAVKSFAEERELSDDYTLLLCDFKKRSIVQEFELDGNFKRFEDINVQVITGPDCFNDGIARILYEMDRFSYPDPIIRNIKAVMLKALGFFCSNAAGMRKEKIYSAYTCSESGLRICLFSDSYHKDNPVRFSEKELEDISTYVDDVSLLAEGRKLVIYKNKYYE